MRTTRLHATYLTTPLSWICAISLLCGCSGNGASSSPAGLTCGPGTVEQQGQCVALPGDSGLDADGAAETSSETGPCTDTSSDPNNCGACGHVCPHLPGAEASCAAGSCTQACDSDHTDCNKDLANAASDGCEAVLASDPANCGTCGKGCGGDFGPKSQPACEDFSCKAGCQPGFADCNHDLGSAGGDGCEADLTSDAQNCGECVNVCTGACSASVCVGEQPFCSLFSDITHHAVALSLATNGTGFALAWLELQNYPHSLLRFALLDSKGKPLGSPTYVADVNSYDRFGVAFDGTSYILAWSTWYPKASSSNLLAVRRHSPTDLSPQGEIMTTALDVGVLTLFASDAEGSVLLSAGGIGEGRFLSLGHDATSLGAFVAMPTTALKLGGLASVTPVTDGYLTTWKSEHAPSDPQKPTQYGIATFMLDKAGQPQGNPEDLDPKLNSTTSSVARVGGGAVLGASGDLIGSTLAWPKIWGHAIDAHGKLSGAWTQLLDVDHSVSFTLVDGFQSAAWVLSQDGTAHTAQAVGAQASVTGAKIALGKAPTATSYGVAKGTAAGTLFLWLRSRQVGSNDEYEYAIEAAFVSAQGDVSCPVDG